MNLNRDFSPKHIQNLSKEEAHINLFSEIGGDGIDGQSFADEIQLLNQIGIETINIHINSGGGSVIDGFSIFSAINNSESHVNVFIEGIAASMAGVIAMAGHRIYMTDYSKIMIHNPHTGGEASEDEKVINALAAMRDSLMTILNNRSGKNISEAKMSKIMDAETWISPVEALEMGMIDEIVKSKKPKRQAKAAIMDILNSYDIININNNKKDMKQIAKHFGLNEDASEETVLKSVQEVSNKIEKLESELTDVRDELKVSNEEKEALQNKVNEFEAKAEELENQLVEETIDEAIEKGTFSKEDKAELLDQYKGNAAGLKSIVSKIKVSAPNVVAQLEGKKAPSSKDELPADLKDKNWRELDKAGELDRVKAISETAYFAKYKEYYGKDHASFVAAE